MEHGAFNETLAVIASLNLHAVEYVVVGGVALNVHGLVRATEDLDLFVRPTPENIARLRSALRAVWDDPDIDEITAEDLCGEYPAVRYGPPTGAIYLDVMTRLGTLATWADLEATDVCVQGIKVRVATPKTLFWMKRDTVRPIDHADAAALRDMFGLEDG